METMKTVEENRRDWLVALIDQHGSIAALNIKLDRDRTDATLSQIKNQSTHHKTGKPRTMGSEVARDIEEKLGLERGALDYPPLSINHHSHLFAAEPLAQYKIQTTWPFKTITEQDWFSTDESMRDMLERQIKAAMPLAANANDPARSQETMRKMAAG
jgi:hypothetical protein